MTQDSYAAKSTDTEQTIIAVSAELFSEKGFEGTSIRDIARAAGMSSAALYHHFVNKHSIYERIVVDVVRDQTHFTQKELENTFGASNKLRVFMLAYGKFFVTRAAACSAAANSHSVLEISAERRRWRDEYEGILRDIFKEGQTSGEFRDLDPSMAGRAVLSCLNWLHRWYDHRGSQSVSSIIETFADMLLGGCLSSSGVRDEAHRRSSDEGEPCVP